VKTIWNIAVDSLRALLHQRLLLGLMLASLGMIIFFAVTLGAARKNIRTNYEVDETSTNIAFPPSITNKMNEADQRKFREQMDSASSSVISGLYLVASFGGSIVALFIFSTAVAGEIRKGTIRLTLSKPVSRRRFLLGKYLGGVMVMAGYALLSSVAVFIFTQTQEVAMISTLQWAPWLMFCRQLMLGALAMLLSLFMHPIVAAVLAFLAGNGLYSQGNPLYYILPSYKDFNVFFELLQGTVIRPHDVAMLSLYALDFVIIMLLLALWRFRSKELV
jgi:ABC-type transport system involved in multi-copper enzyme maturation permease subunit